MTTPKTEIYFATRKTSSAHVYITKGQGKVRINNVPLEMIPQETAREVIFAPLEILTEEARRHLEQAGTHAVSFPDQAMSELHHLEQRLAFGVALDLLDSARGFDKRALRSVVRRIARIEHGFEKLARVASELQREGRPKAVGARYALALGLLSKKHDRWDEMFVRASSSARWSQIVSGCPEPLRSTNSTGGSYGERSLIDRFMWFPLILLPHRES